MSCTACRCEKNRQGICGRGWPLGEGSLAGHRLAQCESGAHLDSSACEFRNVLGPSFYYESRSSSRDGLDGRKR